MNFLEFGPISAKHTIGFFALFHVSVASLGIGLAFLVLIAQITGYRNKLRSYDLFAKRTQLFHVCIYNIGTVNAIGLVFALSGLYPQFWEQLFVHQFWILVVEEVLFLLLATTITFHYFFWDLVWGHKKAHIVLGSLLTVLFFLQFFLINGIGSFMLTPGTEQEASVSLAKGIIGWDMSAFYNPTFLMLQLHRSFANISYAGFFMAGWCGLRLFTSKDAVKRRYYEENGRLVFSIAFAALLALPIVGYFYALVLKTEASDSFYSLMHGVGDVVVAGVDLWWVKQIFVVLMIGIGLGYFGRKSAAEPKKKNSMPFVLLVAVAIFYIVYYLGMGMVMTWAFFFWMLFFGVAGFFLATFLMRFSSGSGRLAFMLMGVLGFGTVMLGGWSREAARPRFVERYSHYDNIYVPEERQRTLMVKPDGQSQGLAPDSRGSAQVAAESSEGVVSVGKPTAVASLPDGEARSGGSSDSAQLIRANCSQCHSLSRIRVYPKVDWKRVVAACTGYGASLAGQEARLVIEHLDAKLSY